MSLSYDEVFTFDNLFKAYKSAIKGVRWKTATKRFIYNDIILVNKLYNELKNRTYKTKGFKVFTICERGKMRTIKAVSLRERIVQKCLCNNYLCETLEKSFIYDNGACVKGKGITFAIKRIDTHLHRFYNHNKTNGYSLTIDLHHYFDTIDHDILLNKLGVVIKDLDLYNLLKMLITDFGTNKGLGLGSEISQICALFYLSKLDHFIKERLGEKYYLRYMDDFIIINKSKEKLENDLKLITIELNKLGLTTNGKTKITPLVKGFDFMKIKFRLLSSGKVIHKMETKKYQQIKHKIKTLKKKNVSMNNVRASYKGYFKRYNEYFKYKKIV